MRIMKSVIFAKAGSWLLLGLALVGLSCIRSGTERGSCATTSSAA